MVDVGSWAQVWKLGFKAPWFGGVGNPLPKDDKKKDEQKKADSSSSVQQKEQSAPSFKWVENLQEEAANRKQQNLDKLKTDSQYKQSKINELEWDKASVWQSWELWYKQTLKSIWNDWKKSMDKSKKEFDADLEKAKEDDGKVWFWEYLKASAKDAIKWAWRLAWNTISSVAKLVWWWLDYAQDTYHDLKYMDKKAEEAGVTWPRTKEQREKWANEAKEDRINKMLAKNIEEEDTVKEVATDRAIENATIMQAKEAEVSWVYDDLDNAQTDYSNTASQAIKTVMETQWVDEMTAARIVEDDVNGKVSWPVWDTNYLATINALKDKKTSLESKWDLFNQKMEEYDQLSREHRLKEFELSPYTDNYYETSEEAERYLNMFWNKLYKDADGNLMSLGDQRDRDVYSILKRLEWTVFGAAEWVRDENMWRKRSLFYDDTWIWQAVGKEDYNWMVQQDFLKNTDWFLNMTYDTFADLKQKLMDNYEALCDKTVNGSWEEVLQLNQSKVAAFLKQNKSGLSKISDYITEAKTGTEYMDVKLWRYKDWTEGGILQIWKDLWWLKDLLWSLTESETKEWVWLFSYDKPRDWINMSTDNYWFRDAAWSMVASNPAQTAYVAGSTYFAVFGKGQRAVKWHSMRGSLWQATLRWQKWWKYVSMADGITKALDSAKWTTKIPRWQTQTVQKTVDFIARKWLWVLDEAFVSLPLDLWLNDWTETDLWMNVIFNGLWWLGKIQWIDNLHIMERTVAKQSTPEAMKAMFAKETWIPELADKIRWSVWDSESLIKGMNKAINSHITNILMSDSNKAAWYMSQTLAKNIDAIQWENLDEVDALTKAITENGNIWASLSKNRSKNIQRILSNAKAKIAKTKNWTDILTIQNKAVADIKSEFKSILDSFDVEKLNKLYKRKFAADKIWQGFSSFINEWSDATGVPKADLMLVFMDSMNTKAWKNGSNVVELFKKRVIEWVSDGSIKSSKWARTAVREINKVAEGTDEAMWAILDISKIAESDPETAAAILSRLDEDWIHDMRETYKMTDTGTISKEEERIAQELEKSKKAIEEEKNATIDQAIRENRWVSKMDMWTTQWKWDTDTLTEMRDKWQQVLNYAKQISNDEWLLNKIREAEEAYAKNNPIRGNELEDVIAKDKERRYNSFQDEADEAGMSLEEYHKAQNLKYDKLLEDRAVTNWLKENKGGITRAQYEKQLADTTWDWTRATLPVNQRQEIIENYLKEKYWFDFSDEVFRKELEDEYNKIYREDLPELYDQRWLFTNKEESSIAQKFNMKYERKTWWTIKWDINSLTPEEIADVNKALTDELGWEAVTLSKENIEKAANNIWWRIDVLETRLWKIRESLGSNNIENPYKEFSTAVNNYIEDMANTNKLAAGEKASQESLEKRFLTVWADTAENKLNNYNNILWKLDPALKTDSEKAIAEGEEAIRKATEEAEKTAAQKIAEAEQRALSMTNEVKKLWLQNKVNEWINKLLDFFENNAVITNKTKVLDSVRTITSKMDNVTRDNFLWSLWSIIEDFQKWNADPVILRNLSKSITDSWGTKTMNAIVNEVKKWIKNWDGTYDIVKLKDFVWDWLYEANKTKWANQLVGKEVDDVIKEAIQLKVAQNMSNSILGASAITDASKTAEEIAEDVIRQSWEKIKDTNLSKANQLLWKQSTDAMVLYQRALDSAYMKTTGKTSQELAEETMLAQAKADVSTKSSKRVAKEKKQRKIDEAAQADKEAQTTENITEEAPTASIWDMDSWLAESIKKWTEKQQKLTKEQQKVTQTVTNKTLTEKEKTLMRFGAVEEASKIMEAVSKGKKPWTIRAEFLDWEWFAFLARLLDFKADEWKEFELFVKGFIDSRKEVQWIWYQLFHWLKNVLFNGSSSLKTSTKWFTLNDILSAVPARITSNIKWEKTWWVIYDPRVTLTKYLMESNPEEATKFMKWALAEYFKKALTKESRSNLWENFLRAFDKQSSKLDMPDVVAEEFMNLYTKTASKLRSYWVEDRIVQDILNPMFYNPLEYIRWVGMWNMGNVFKWDALDDMILGTVLKKYQWQRNLLPEQLIEKYNDVRKAADSFEKFTGWALIRNRNALEFGDALWEYMNKVDSLPIGKEQFAEWMNKTLSHVVGLWDDITRRVTALDSLLTPVYNKAKKALSEDDYASFITNVDKFLFREEWGLKHSKELREWYNEFVESIKKLWIDDDETKDIFKTLDESINTKETWESRVITNFLYDRVSKDADEYLKASWKSADKFNPADIINRKNIQEWVREKYEQASADEILAQIRNSNQKKVVKTKDWWTVVSNKAKEKNKAVLEAYWRWEEETKLAEDIIGDIDMEKLLETWELPKEESMREILRRITVNWESYEKLMSEKWFFRERVNDSIEKTFDDIEKAWGREYFSVWKNGEFVLRQEAEEFNWLQKFASHLTTRGNVMNQNRETQWILSNIQKNKETSYVISDIDFWTILGKKNIDTIRKSMSLESFISMWKASIYELAGKMKKWDRSAIIQESINRVFRWIRKTEADWIMSSKEAKEFVMFLSKYREWIDKTRKTLELWDHRWFLFENLDLAKWVPENKLANRLSWIWNYASNEDISRLAAKYNKWNWLNGLWENFTQNILYNARADLSDSKWIRALDWLNIKAQKYAILRNYNVTNVTKAGQQVVSNMLHANGILKSVSVAWTSEFDNLYKMIQNSEMRNLWFDIFESEWKYWERIFDKTIKEDWRKTYQRKKDSWVMKNIYLFWKDIVTSNALMRWDRATQKWAVKSSLALAVDDIYKQGWTEAVEAFTEKLKKFDDLLKKYDFKERDLMDKDRFFKKVNQSSLPERLSKRWIAEEADMAKYFAESNEDFKFIYDFYRNEYAPFFGKARTSMGTFFVMDNIKELGSINVVDNNKYMFWLMKWSTGKIWEYLFDIWTAFWKSWWTKRWFFEAISQPVFQRLFNEMAVWARAMWEVEKMTNHEFTIADWMKATVVPVAAVWMLFWESMIDWAVKSFWPDAWEQHWSDFVSHVFNTTLDSAYEFLTDRAFIYLGMLGTDAGASYTTADVIWMENSKEFRTAFAHTWARKFYVNNPLNKFTHLRSSWYETDATQLINPSTILAEIWLNQTSSARQLFSDINSEIYDMAKSTYEDQDKWYDKIWDWIPVIKNAKQAWRDMWVLLPMLESKVDDSWARAFLKETTSRTELARLINNMEKNKTLWDKEFQAWVAKNLWTLNKEDDAAVKQAMIRAGKYKDNLEAWNIVKNWLNKSDLYWKWESALWLTMLTDEEKDELYSQFTDMYQTYVIDKWKSDAATTEMFDKFVLAATKYGWSMSMSGYMWAFLTAYKRAARDYYDISSAEVNAWKKWDDWLAAEEDIDVTKIPDSKMWKYVEYVDAVRNFELWLIVDNWSVLSREKSIWIELLNKYIETDKDNFWWNSYLGAIGDEKSNLSKLWNTLNYNEIAKEQWLPWMIVPLAYQEKKASDNYLKLLNKAQTPEEIADAASRYLWIQESLWWLADKYIDNPQASWLVKASLASWIVAYADQIKKKSPEVLEKVIDIIGEKAINKVLNSLTDSPTVTLADAFEIATWTSAHSGGSGKWKAVKASIPSAKARENYVNKMLIPNYNRAKAAAAWTGWGDGVSLPKFTNGYGRAKDGSIISAKIPVPQRKQLTELPTNSVDTKTAKLDVAPLPVKEWRVIGWKYSARAIQNAKVYSRRIGK